MVHEAVGHGVASRLTGDHILSISTVALQNESPNRLVSAAGTFANCVFGCLTLLLLRGERRFSSRSYFLWLFAAFNLFNSGYLIASAILRNGDWANVIAGLSPTWVWRTLLAAVGAGIYILAVRFLASSLSRISGGSSSSTQAWQLILPAYLGSGVVMTLSSVFNPISPSLILVSGVGASFGLNAGLLFLPGMVADQAHQTKPDHKLEAPFSLGWLLVSLVLTIIFLAILGPGIHFA